MTTSGTLTEYQQPDSLGLSALTVGPDKHLWFTTYRSSYIGRVSLTGKTNYFQDPSGQQEFPIVAGPDKNLWFGFWQTIGVYIRQVLSVQPQSIAFQGKCRR